MDDYERHRRHHRGGDQGAVGQEFDRTLVRYAGSTAMVELLVEFRTHRGQTQDHDPRRAEQRESAT